jgi:ribonuclease HII
MPSTRVEKLIQYPLSALNERLASAKARIPAGLIEALEEDGRQGAKALAERLRERQRSARRETRRLANLLRFEQELWDQGTLHVAGVDEAGMAPLAGPVVAAAVVLPRDFRPRGIDDSKKILDPERRDQLAVEIKAAAIAWAIGRAEVEEIDRINIYHAGLLAMRRAVEGLKHDPGFILVDARRIPGIPHAQRGIIRGDSLSMSIAAASILAKTTRDGWMRELDLAFPGYGLAKHKGYPTPEHCERLRTLGATEIHRRSFAPVRQALGLPPVEVETTQLVIEEVTVRQSQRAARAR